MVSNSRLESILLTYFDCRQLALEDLVAARNLILTKDFSSS